MSIETHTAKGWEVVRLRSGRVEADVVPEKGGDILAIRWLPLDLDVLWKTPWGLRPKGALPSGGSSQVHWLENYPGGWQTIFPNGGDPSVIGGVEQGFHGEACLVPWDWKPVDSDEGSVTIELHTRLSRTPFVLTRRLTVSDAGVDVVETAQNVGRVPLEVMWSHHPAFGAPFLSGACTIETGAAWFEADDSRPSELAQGMRTTWLGGDVDLTRVPGVDERVERMGYLGGFDDRAWAAITNPDLGLRVELSWDSRVMPHAWHWLEAHATKDFPWYAEAYVLALEPASSYPGQGAAVVASKTGTLLSFAPGEERTAHISLQLSSTAS